MRDDVLRRIMMVMDSWYRFTGSQGVGVRDGLGRDSGRPNADVGGPLIPPSFYFCHLGAQNLGTPTVTMQVVGAWLKDTCRAGVGWCMDSGPMEEPPTGAGAGFGLGGFASPALHAEALAVRHALLWAHGEHFQSIRVLTDAANLVTLLQGTGHKDMALWWTIKEIRRVGSLFSLCEVFKVDRKRIARAHAQATFHVKQ